MLMQADDGYSNRVCTFMVHMPSKFGGYCCRHILYSTSPASSTATTTVKIDHSSAGLLAKRGVGYTAEEDETAKSIAQKLGVDVVDLVALNKQRYPALTRTRRLLHGTVLLIPDTPGASDGNRVIGQKRVRLTQLGVLVNLLGQ